MINTEEATAAKEKNLAEDAIPGQEPNKPFTPVDRLAQSKLDQKFQNSIDVNPEDMFGNSID